MNSWEALRTFKVETLTGTNKLFANGWQQVKLGITIEAVDINNVTAALSATEYASLELYNYRDGRPLQFITAEGVKSGVDRARGHTDWSMTQDRSLKYFPGPESRMAGFSSRQTAVHTDVWVRTLSDTELRISARITRDDGKTFSSSDMPDGEVKLLPVPVPNYTAADFNLRKVNITERTKGSPLRVDYYYLSLRPSGVGIGIAQFTMSPKSLYANPYSDYSYADLTGHTAPGSSGIDYAVNNGQQRPSTLVSRPAAGEVALVMVRHMGRAAIRDILSLPKTQRSHINIKDVYGNFHRLSVRSTHSLLINDIELY